jgi:hypothetical protein
MEAEQRANMYTIGNVLARREAFEAKHPEISITPATATRSGRWEVSAPGADLMSFSNAGMMMYALEDIYHEVEPVEGSWYTTIGRPADPNRGLDYPIEAVCKYIRCSSSIKKEHIDAEWEHFKR